MISNHLDISGRLALDAQSVDKLRLQARQDPEQAIKAVARQFESLFLGILLKNMREASPEDGLLDSEQGKLYTQMLDQQLAQKLSSGKGMGLADMLIKQLSHSGRSLPPEAAASGRNLPPSAKTAASFSRSRPAASE